jgi:intracellular sulfur oxidation DsrE/DsrF family protein
MKPDLRPSDEYLNAFVDNQLDPEEKSQVFWAVTQDKELNQRACEFRRLHEMVQHAYETPPPAATAPPPLRRRALSGGLRALAASLLLALGALVGWVGHNQFNQGTEPVLALNNSQLEHLVTGTNGVILHLSSDAPGKVDAALDRTQNLLDLYQKLGRNVRVELVVNGPGLDLLRSDTSPAAARVRALQARYHNLTFLACRKAIERLKLEKGIDAKLLKGTHIAPSALQQIVTRLEQGWTYIQI